MRIADFGTRRRHSYLWQDWANEAARHCLGASYIGTSNVHIAMTQGLEAIGTNAHELPMVMAALADTDDELRAAPYKVLDMWQTDYGENLRVFLPDAYGTTAFLDGAPAWLATWRGMRPDSKDPVEAAEEAIAWWESHGEDPRTKLLTIADGMDADSIIACTPICADGSRCPSAGERCSRTTSRGATQREATGSIRCPSCARSSRSRAVRR